MNLFVAGASGYLGHHLIKALSKEHQVFALIRSTSSSKRIEGICADIIYVDETDDALENAFALYRPTMIINTVALYGRKGESLNALINANIDFPTQLLGLAKKYECTAFIHTGTSLPDDISPYALTKNTFVKLARFHTETPLKFIHVALEHFYGPEDDSSKFTSYVFKACLAGDKLALTDGVQQRDFIYIEDVINAYKTLIKNIGKLNSFETIPVGSGVAPTVRELVEMIHSCSHSKSELAFGTVAMRENEQMYSCADISRLKQLGWQLKYSLEAGIQATLKGKE